MKLLTGSLGAILDEYQKASGEFQHVIKNIPQKDFTKIVDEKTSDEDCRSVQTITRHVIRSGYGYANYILNALDIDTNSPDVNKMKIENADDGISGIRDMIEYNLRNLYELNREQIEERMFSVKFTTRWGEEFNFEQILEHAIVHILRHRRQTEKFIGIMKNN
jgi:uncharacterized damage-inducible protein DinB